MKQDEPTIIIYTNGTTVEVPASVIYDPFPTPPPQKSTDEE